jgi:hypothetical protein
VLQETSFRDELRAWMLLERRARSLGIESPHGAHVEGRALRRRGFE